MYSSRAFSNSLRNCALMSLGMPGQHTIVKAVLGGPCAIQADAFRDEFHDRRRAILETESLRSIALEEGFGSQTGSILPVKKRGRRARFRRRRVAITVEKKIDLVGLDDRRLRRFFPSLIVALN